MSAWFCSILVPALESDNKVVYYQRNGNRFKNFWKNPNEDMKTELCENGCRQVVDVVELMRRVYWIKQVFKPN